MTSQDGALGLALFDDANIQDPYGLYARMHDTGPVHRIGTSTFYAVSGRAAVDEAVSRCADFSSNLTATMTYQPGVGVFPFPVADLGSPIHALATADEPLHSVHRKALLPHLSPRRVRSFEPLVAQTYERLWAPGADGTVEWMTIANTLPMMIVARIIGVPDDDVERLTRWGYSATQVVEGLVTPSDLEAAGIAVMELGAYVTERFAHAAADPGDDLLGDLATACARGDIDDVAAVTMMITLFSAGGESTASLLGSAAWILATHPDVQDLVRSDPELIVPFLEEVLRVEPPFRGHYRHVVADTTLCGVDLPAGARLLLLWGAANRDPSHVDDPAEFRLDRPTGTGHLGFGRGVHFCVGAALARLEARVVIGYLLERSARLDAVRIGRWLPSLLVRRLDDLRLAVS